MHYVVLHIGKGEGGGGGGSEGVLALPAGALHELQVGGAVLAPHVQIFAFNRLIKPGTDLF